MILTTLQTLIANETGLDPTNDATTITRWINSAYRTINGLFAWPWLLKSSTFQTSADITSGTVSINAGSTSLTFSSAPSVSVANQWMINFPTVSNDWYYITAHNAMSTSATLGVPLIGSTNLSGASYVLRKVFYSLPSDLDRLIDIRQSITKIKLVPIDTRTYDYYLPEPTSVAQPVYYAPMGVDTSGYYQVTLYPIPDTTYNMQIRYFKTTTDLSSGSDVPNIPEKFQDLIVFGALAMYGHDYIDDTRVSEAATRYANLLSEMKEEYSPMPDILTVLQPWDLRPTYPTFRLRFPSNFPYPYGGY